MGFLLQQYHQLLLQNELAIPTAFSYLKGVNRDGFNTSNSIKTVRNYMDSIIKFGQYVKHIRTKKGMTQLQLSLKIFDKPNYEYIGRLERGELTKLDS